MSVYIYICVYIYYVYVYIYTYDSQIYIYIYMVVKYISLLWKREKFIKNHFFQVRIR